MPFLLGLNRHGLGYGIWIALNSRGSLLDFSLGLNRHGLECSSEDDVFVRKGFCDSKIF